MTHQSDSQDITNKVPQHQVLHCQGLDSLKRGFLVKAEEQLRNSLRLNPGNSDGWYHLAITMAKNGKSEEALKYLERAISFNLNNITYLFEKANVLLVLGQTDQARQIYLLLISRSTQAECSCLSDHQLETVMMRMEELQNDPVCQETFGQMAKQEPNPDPTEINQPPPGPRQKISNFKTLFSDTRIKQKGRVACPSGNESIPLFKRNLGATLLKQYGKSTKGKVK